MRLSTVLQPLRPLLLIWCGSVVSNLGTHFFNIARVFLAISLMGNASHVGLLLALASLALSLSFPIGGIIADRFVRRNVLIVADLLCGLLMIGAIVLLPFMPDNFSKYLLLVICTVGISICTGIFGPAISAIIPDLVAEPSVGRANATFFASNQIAQILGQGIGGLLLVKLGAIFLFTLNGVSFFLSAALTAGVPATEHKREAAITASIGSALVSDLVDGFRHIMARPLLAKATCYLSVSNAMFISIFVLAPFIAIGRASSPALEYGLYVGSLSAGMLIGSVVLLWINPKSIKSIHFLVLGIIEAINYALVGGIDDTAISIFGYFNIGVAKVIIGVLFNVAVVECTAEELRGRAFGASSFIATITSPPVFLGSGILVDILSSPSTLFISISVVLLASSILIFLVPMVHNHRKR